MAEKTHSEAMMVKRDNGVYSLDGAAVVEDWNAVRSEADEVEHLGPLVGWGEWSDAYRVRVLGCDLYYFAR